MADGTVDRTMPRPLPWQVTLLAHLLQQHGQHRLHHAWLLQGPEGTGKNGFAEALASARLCGHRDVSARPCGDCKSCALIRAGNHPDLLRIQPEEGKSVLKVDQVRKMGEFVSQTASYPGSARVVILDPAEGLGQGAANALLKNLEEPPGDSLFLLISHVPGAVLPTIRSRCQPLPMPEPEQELSRQWLLERVDDEQQVATVLRLAPGRPLKGLQLIEQRIPALFRFLEDNAPAALRGDLALAELLHGCQDNDARQVLAWLLHDLHRRVLDRVAAREPAAGSIHGVFPLFAGYRQLLEMDRQLAGTANPNRQLSLESAFLHWKRVVLQCH